MTDHDDETRRKEIIEMAREAGFTDWWINPPEPERRGMCYGMLARLVEIAQAKERARHIHSAKVTHLEGIGSAELMGLLEKEQNQVRKPLTKYQIWDAIRPLTSSDEYCAAIIDISMDEYRAIERAIERANGINGDIQ